MIDWCLSIAWLCVSRCKPIHYKNIKTDFESLKALLLEQLPACIQPHGAIYQDLFEGISFKCRKIVFHFPVLFFSVCGDPHEARKRILDAFENDDISIISAIASECCAEKNRDWLELGSYILNGSRDKLDVDVREKYVSSFLDALIANSMNAVELESDAISYPIVSNKIQVLQFFHEIFLVN